MPSAEEQPCGTHQSRKSPRMWSIRKPAADPQHRAHHVANRRVAGFGEPVRPPGRQAPVLALLVETVRRGTDGEPVRQLALQRPGISSARIDADGQVMHDADRHSCRRRGLLRAGELLRATVLQPTVIGDPVGQLLARRCTAGAPRILQRRGPAPPVGPVPFGQCAPGREIGESGTVLGVGPVSARSRLLAPG